MPSVKVKGMSCNHCKQGVEKALLALKEVESAEVDLMAATVTWTEKTGQALSFAKLKETITSIGFEVEE